MKRESAEPQGFIKPTGVGIPRLQAGEEVKSSIVRKRPGRIITGMFKRFTVILLTIASLSVLSACSGVADVRMGPASDVRVEAVR